MVLGETERNVKHQFCRPVPYDYRLTCLAVTWLQQSHPIRRLCSFFVATFCTVTYPVGQWENCPHESEWVANGKGILRRSRLARLMPTGDGAGCKWPKCSIVDGCIVGSTSAMRTRKCGRPTIPGAQCTCWSSCIIMAALRSRCGHYIFALWFVSSSFFPRLISAVADWMSTILAHMVWP